MTEQEPSVRIEIFDTTLRDGAQSLHQDNQFPKGSKVALADRIAMLGTDTIEAGFPATMGDEEEIAEVARTVGQAQYEVTPTSIENGEWVDLEPKIWTPVITGLARAVPEEIEQAARAVGSADRPGIHVFIATAEEHMRAKHPSMTREAVLQMGMEGIRHARDAAGEHATIEFSCEAASTTDMVFLERAVRLALQEDIDVINLPDTLGAASPIRMGKIFEMATRVMIEEGRAEEVAISSHNHDDGQRAVQNAISSLHAVINTAKEMGVKPPDFQVEGVWMPGGGERNGNLFIPPFVRNVLTDRPEFETPVELTIASKKMKAVVEYLMNAAGLSIEPNTPVVGENTIVHRSGVHSDAIIKGGAATYAAVDNRGFGHAKAAIIGDGKYQGKRGRENLGGTDIYRSELIIQSEDTKARIEAMALQINEEQAERITVMANKISKGRGVAVADNELEKMAAQELGIELEDRYKIEDFDFHGTRDVHTAEVNLSDESGQRFKAVENHSGGSIEALVHAVNSAINYDGDVKNWEAKPVFEEGSASEGAVTFFVENGHKVSVFSKSRSIDEASLRGYIEGINLIQRIDDRKKVIPIK